MTAQLWLFCGGEAGQRKQPEPAKRKRVAVCWECGKSPTHDHHVVPRARGGVKTIPLCYSCHGKVHSREMMTTSALTKAALAAKKARGERVGGLRYGYALAEDGATLVENGPEQAVIAEARALSAAGLSLRAVAAELGRRGYLSRTGGAFAATQIQRMLDGGWAPTI
jgi:hypothetical protein